MLTRVDGGNCSLARAGICRGFEQDGDSFVVNDVLLSPATQNLKKSLMEYVDQRLPSTPKNNPPASQSTTTTTVQPSPAPNQP